MGYICLKMVKHCVPQTWNKPVPGGGGGTQKHPKSVPWNSPFHPFLTHQTRDGTPRPVPSRPVPPRCLLEAHWPFGSSLASGSIETPKLSKFAREQSQDG
ncbi:hypothetical protein DVH24_024695 [Malus domestica]|uniref:Uncharacterized protein n=1 Tax=Malus domestica TaxID=3750 RepID=A0A498JNU9_MALDO|nr:hypothetical protein DVH24_024695 [Malus domestica]